MPKWNENAWKTWIALLYLSYYFISEIEICCLGIPLFSHLYSAPLDNYGAVELSQFVHCPHLALLCSRINIEIWCLKSCFDRPAQCCMITASQHAMETTTPRVLSAYLQMGLLLCLGKQYLSVTLNCACTHSSRDLGLHEELWEEEEMWFFRWFLRPHASLCDTERCRASCCCWGEAAKAPSGSVASGGKGSCKCWCSITYNAHSPASVQCLRASQAFLRHQVRKGGVVKGMFTCFEMVHHMYVALGSYPTLSRCVLLWVLYK